ncbi:hypothetical protein A0H81_09290 [Grifola frondosa]|uniref:Uncharacterized protein n=1 Tax=Grifola frondosa TaxID=5627 RepID=A0A1C7M2T1_GRIFR|nr:hypothetical protein A0H81_09290 [Grifola frondosa]
MRLNEPELQLSSSNLDSRVLFSENSCVPGINPNRCEAELNGPISIPSSDTCSPRLHDPSDPTAERALYINGVSAAPHQSPVSRIPCLASIFLANLNTSFLCLAAAQAPLKLRLSCRAKFRESAELRKTSMARFRVFTGAPSANEIIYPANSYHWHTVSRIPSQSPPPLNLPPATVEAASRRISLLYENIIFHDSQTEDPNDSEIDVGDTRRLDAPGMTNLYDPQFIEADSSPRPDNRHHLAATAQDTTGNPAESKSDAETQESYDSSDASSIARFPAFYFSLHSLTSLTALSNHAQAIGGDSPRALQVTVLVAVLEVDGPDAIRIKKGAEAGKEVSLLKLVLGDADGAVCRLTAWREVAESWGGASLEDDAPGIKKGDIVLLESASASAALCADRWHLADILLFSLPSPSFFFPTDVLASWEVEPGVDALPITLTASPHLRSQLEICYRTLPFLQRTPASARPPARRERCRRPHGRRGGALVRRARGAPPCASIIIARA